MTTTEQHRVPTFVKRLAVVAVAAIVAVVGIAVWWHGHLVERREASCREQVQEREDDRAVWLYLVHENPDSPRLPAFLAFFNERLPELTCLPGEAIPVPASTTAITVTTESTQP